MSKLREEFKEYTNEVKKCVNCIDWDDCPICIAKQDTRKNSILDALDKADALDIIVENNIPMSYFKNKIYASKDRSSYRTFILGWCDPKHIITKEQFEFLVKVFTKINAEKS